ncbi:MAG: hypothetical protein PHU21_02670 [Elusimicrobia bacterium]|nr:hypothetical protein [Elusimicrobiota bacterium]
MNTETTGTGTGLQFAGGFASLLERPMPMPLPARMPKAAPASGLGLGGLAAVALSLTSPVFLLQPGRRCPAAPAAPAPIATPAPIFAPAPARVPVREAVRADLAPAPQPKDSLSLVAAAQDSLAPFSLTQNDSGVEAAKAAPSVPAATRASAAAEPRASWARPRRPHLRPNDWSQWVERSGGPSGFVRMKFGPSRLVSVPAPQPAPARRMTHEEELWAHEEREAGYATRKVDKLPLVDVKKINFDGVVKMKLIAQTVTADGGSYLTHEVTYKDGTKAYCQTDPLVFDLGGKGIQTSGAMSQFDIRGDNKLVSVRGVSSGAGILVFDADQNGISGESGLELFGDLADLDGDGRADGFPDGFQALKALMAKAVREGVLDAETLAAGRLDSEALAQLDRSYGLKMKVGGLNHPAVALRRAGIAAIALPNRSGARRQNFDGRGNDLLVQQDAVFTRLDGSQGTYADLWLTHRVRQLAPAPLHATRMRGGFQGLYAQAGNRL